LLVRIITEAIWPCIEQTLDHFAASRDKNLPPFVRAGINFSIILGSACYLEGTLETLLQALLEHRRKVFSQVTIPDFETRRSMNVFYSRLEEDFSVRIARSLGADGYNDMFDLLVGTPLKQFKAVKPLWEPITVLFNFRNVLGHGRQVRARDFSGATVEGGFREEYFGSYRRVEDYLRKYSLLDRRFPDAASEYIFLQDDIADHFWAIAKQIPEAVIESLPPEEAGQCARALETVKARPLDA
jgi:hypothetical protein